MKAGLSFLPLILFAFLIGTFIVTLHHSKGPKFVQHIGDAAPLTDLAVIGQPGVTFSTEDWKGRLYIVNFFASWCVPCRAEGEQLKHVSAADIPVIGIAYKDKTEAVKTFLENEGNPFVAVASDDSGHSGIDWGITGVPETFVIDKSGVIRFHLVGVLTDEIIEEQIFPLVQRLK